MTMCVAIVDQDAAILDATQLVMQEEGWHVCTYATGEAFLADLDRHSPDCVILDPHLPNMNGVEVVRSVASGNDHIPVIGLTARPESPMIAECMEAGARVMLTKPVTFEELLDHIQAAISSVSDR